MGQLYKNKIYTYVLFSIVSVIFFSTCWGTPPLFCDQEARLSYTIRIPVAINPAHSLEIPIRTPLQDIPSIISTARQNLGLPPSIPFDQQNDFLQGWQIMRNSRIESDMPGYVLVEVSEGARVGVDSPLGVIECMKMFCTIGARSAGKITHIFAEPGKIVGRGSVLFGFAPDRPLWNDIPPADVGKEVLSSFFPIQEAEPNSPFAQDTPVPSEEEKTSPPLPLAIEPMEQITPVSPEAPPEETQEPLAITKEAEPPQPPMSEEHTIPPVVSLEPSQVEEITPVPSLLFQAQKQKLAIATYKEGEDPPLSEEAINEFSPPLPRSIGKLSPLTQYPGTAKNFLPSLNSSYPNFQKEEYEFTMMREKKPFAEDSREKRDSRLHPHTLPPFLGNSPLTHMTLALGAHPLSQDFPPYFLSKHTREKEPFYHAPLSSPLKRDYNNSGGVKGMREHLISQLLALLILAFILRIRLPSPIHYRAAQRLNRFVSIPSPAASNVNESLKVWRPRRKAF